ncbi:unnamed protein product [Danaus chrysippus]|uniref:(African queen) hypothetical protein n=1 Tax=Danaus chrysippus TaxID=151541 RepID=A0A8J2QCE3_9NEOP|nr:unnamed protein product [Danaus chrysippus]
MFEGYPSTEHEERGGGHTGYNSQYAVPVYKVVALFDVFTRKKLITDPGLGLTHGHCAAHTTQESQDLPHRRQASAVATAAR